MDTTGRIGEKPFLPDDIITDILSRLPAKKARQCRLVCKTWRDLTLTRDFVDLHFRHSYPIILVSDPGRNRDKVDFFFLLDKWWELPRSPDPLLWDPGFPPVFADVDSSRPNGGFEEREGVCFCSAEIRPRQQKQEENWDPKADDPSSLAVRKKFMIHTFHVDSAGGDFPYKCYAIFSHAGLVVYYHSGRRSYIVGNPMDLENVRITLSKEICWSQIHGVFFHPSRKEYCSLWMIQKSNEPFSSRSNPKWIKYKILSLGSNPSMKTISNPFSHRVKAPSPPYSSTSTFIGWLSLKMMKTNIIAAMISCNLIL